MDVIRITGLTAEGVIGLHAPERAKRQTIVVDLALHLDLSKIGSTDDVRDGVNYSDVVRSVRIHVESAQRHTIESLAVDVAGICLGKYPVDRVDVAVSKPAAEKYAAKVSAEISRSRDQLTTTAYIAVGSNVDPDRNLPAAVSAVTALGPARASTVYQSAAIGVGADFLNAVVELRTCLPAAELRRTCKRIETDFGRKTGDKAIGRVIADLDVLLVGRQVIRATDVVVPADDLERREDWALGLSELSPHLRHPLTDELFSELREKLGGSMSLRDRPDVLVGSS